MVKMSFKLLAVIRIRGTVGVRKDIKDTLYMLRLRRKHTCVLVNNSPSYLGQLQKVKDYVTWGEINEETLLKLLLKRGRLIGDHPLTENYVKEKLGITLRKFVKEILSGKRKLTDLPDIKPFFRLSPPSKGFKGKIKKPYKAGGELGYRGEKINELIQRMI